MHFTNTNTNTTVISITPLQSDRWRITVLRERLEQVDVFRLVGSWFQALDAATEKGHLSKLAMCMGHNVVAVGG